MAKKDLDYPAFLKVNLPKVWDQKSNWDQYSAVWLITENDVDFKYIPNSGNEMQPVIDTSKLFSPYNNNEGANYIVARPANRRERHAENVIFDQVQFSTA